MKWLGDLNKYDYNNKGINALLGIMLMISIFVIPFDNLPFMEKYLGELSVRGPVYIFILILPLILIYFLISRKIYFKWSVEKVLLAIFLLWTAISIVLNYSSIMSNTFKDRAGIEKVILQIMVIVFMVAIAYGTEFILRVSDITPRKLRLAVLISYVIVLSYALVEILIIKGVDLQFIVEFVSLKIQKSLPTVIFGDRIRSVTGEPSYLGMYCAFAFPWLVSYLFTEKGYIKKIVYGGVNVSLLVLVFLTSSRAAYGIIMVEMACIFFMTLVLSKSKILKRAVLIGGLVVFLLISILNFSSNRTTSDAPGGNPISNFSITSLIQSLTNKNNLSNVARFGMQRAAINMGNDNPILGVGLGQFGFYAKEYVDESALVSDEVQVWISEESEIWPPTLALYPRIVGEQGYVGFILYIIFISYIILKGIYNIVRSKVDDPYYLFVIISFIGVLVSSFNADTYALPQFWILAGILTAYNNGLIKKSNIYS